MRYTLNSLCVLATLMFLFSVMSPALVQAGAPTPLVPIDCNTAVGGCGFSDLVRLTNNILKFMVYFSVPIAAIAFAWAGWLYLSAAGNTGQISKAHSIFMNVALGLVIVLTAFLIVKLILTTLANSGNYVQILNV